LSRLIPFVLVAFYLPAFANRLLIFLLSSPAV
jgi:hypothetical protein